MGAGAVVGAGVVVAGTITSTCARWAQRLYTSPRAPNITADATAPTIPFTGSVQNSLSPPSSPSSESGAVAAAGTKVALNVGSGVGSPGVGVGDGLTMVKGDGVG